MLEQQPGEIHSNDNQTPQDEVCSGVVWKLDRGFPLVRLEDGRFIRCEHAIALVKGERVRAVIGDKVRVSIPFGHDNGIICHIAERLTSFVRKDPTERVQAQVLAANFDQVLVAQPLGQLNIKRLERELVLAHETRARVGVILTKSDIPPEEGTAEDVERAVVELAGPDVTVLAISTEEPESIEAVRELMPAGSVTVLIGKSGVGKSSLVNVLAGKQVQLTGQVREGDGKGRHTTVSRDMIELENGALVMDMPGVRGLGLWEAEEGISAAFTDIEELAAQCKFGDCSHRNEPGCAVRAALEEGRISSARFESYQALKSESSQLQERREQARRMRGEKASDKGRARKPGGHRKKLRGR